MRTESLESLCDLVVDCPHSTPKWTDEGLVVLRNQNIRNGRLDLSDPSFTDQKHFQERIRRAKPQSGDIVITREAPMGEVCMIPEGLECCLGQRQVLLRPRTDIDGRYLFYALQSRFVKEQIAWSDGTGSTVSNIRIPVLKAFEIPRHGNEQEIAETLASLDEKIELNRKQNHTLEAIAQTLFKHWFVDFEFPDENGNPYKSSGGAMQPSELGEIPASWRIASIDDLSDKVAMGPFGSNIKVSTFVEMGVPVISGQHLNETLLEDTTHNYVTEEHAGKLSNSIVGRGDIVFTHAGNIGQVSLIPQDSAYEKYVISQRQFYLRSNQKLTSPIYLVYFFRSRLGQHKLLANASQVGVPSIARPSSYLKSIQVVSPNKEILDRFDAVVAPIHERVSLNRSQIGTLSTLRDTLLPKLMSGELRVA